MASAEQIIEQALAMSEKDRARLAHELLQSLDGEAGAGSFEAWTHELEHRLAEVDDGSVELLSFDDIRKRIAERRAKRS